ncbi:hypothetical protein [Kangiella sediminilitoris]|uniref:Uncharacterized protein n=1 Tax=Kangiella sediminilitoris TaxID=1144748 RepID=A0A1B3BC27_9GAMM|nr:hypothetical protein [Kangiella sediminilitoris]AOE50344.1 hypothetical protein KS2013_1634 [Kangiella sediminilitoris]
METISQIIVVLFAVGLMCFEPVAIIAKTKAIHFLEAFAKTPFYHFLEQTLRLIIGAALVTASPIMLYSDLFGILGWVVIITSLMLIGLPWRWHQKFAQKVIPTVKKYIHVYGVLSFTLGALTLYCLVSTHF